MGIGLDMLRRLNPSWSSRSRGGNSWSAQCSYRATRGGLASKLKYDQFEAHQRAVALAHQPRMQSSSDILHDREQARGLRQGPAPSAKVERGCQSESFCRLLDSGLFQVGAYVLHGPRCAYERVRRCPELAGVVREYLQQDPAIEAHELYNKISRERPRLGVSVQACRNALARARDGLDDAGGRPAPTNMEELITLLKLFAELGAFSVTKVHGAPLAVPIAPRPASDDSPAAFAVRDFERREKALVIDKAVLATALFLNDALALLPFIVVLACDACECCTAPSLRRPPLFLR